jgi:hypothetical protein
MSSSDTERFDPSKRRLCPDGACVGLLDATGRCKECGRTASGKVEEVAAPAFEDGPAFQEDELLEAGNEGMAEVMHATGAQGDDAGFDPKRKLCPDGACVGIIGPDGRCGVCGQAG